MHTELSTMLSEAATLLLVGMSVVFIFLSLLIAAINVIAWLCAKYPEPQERFVSPARAQGVSSSVSRQNISPSTVAAITGAIHQHRNAS